MNLHLTWKVQELSLISNIQAVFQNPAGSSIVQDDCWSHAEGYYSFLFLHIFPCLEEKKAVHPGDPSHFLTEHKQLPTPLLMRWASLYLFPVCPAVSCVTFWWGSVVQVWVQIITVSSLPLTFRACCKHRVQIWQFHSIGELREEIRVLLSCWISSCVPWAPSSAPGFYICWAPKTGLTYQKGFYSPTTSELCIANH
jgi:hypothetical protein